MSGGRTLSGVGTALMCRVAHVIKVYTEVTDKREDGWLQRPLYARPEKEITVRQVDQTAGLERWLVVV
jgi:hypothetical protein